MLPDSVAAEQSAPYARIPRQSEARTLTDTAFVQTRHLLAALHRVKLPEGMDSFEGAGAVAVQVVTGVSVARLLAMAPSAALGLTPQGVLLLWRRGGAAIPSAE